MMIRLDDAIISVTDSGAARLQRRGWNLLEMQTHAHAMTVILMCAYCYATSSYAMMAVTSIVFGFSAVSSYLTWRRSGADYTSNARVVTRLNAQALARREMPTMRFVRTSILLGFLPLSVFLTISQSYFVGTIQARDVVDILSVVFWASATYLDVAYHVGPGVRRQRESRQLAPQSIS